MSKLLLLIAVFGLLSCTKNTKRSSANATDSLQSTTIDSSYTSESDYNRQYQLINYVTENFDEEKSLILGFDCAILIPPSEQQIEEMKVALGKETFYTVADDSQFYYGLAVEMIDSAGIQKVTFNDQFLRLKGESKTWDLDVRKKDLAYWKIILFRTDKEPEVVSVFDFTSAKLKAFFEAND